MLVIDELNREGDRRDDADEPGDGFTNNWLHTINLSVGLLLH